MPIEPEDIRRAVAAHLDDAKELLCEDSGPPAGSPGRGDCDHGRPYGTLDDWAGRTQGLAAVAACTLG